MSDKKTLEQLKTKLIDEVYEVSKKTGVGWGSDEALALIIDGAVEASTAIHQERIKKLVEALEFYADRENWRNPNSIIFQDRRSMGHDIDYDSPNGELCNKQSGGKRARQALQECEGIE